MLKTAFAAVGGVAAALGSALCCAGPVVAVSLGLSGAGLASTFEPVRPYFLGAAGLLLGAGFYQLHREEQKACEPDRPCAKPRVRRRMRIALWVATALAAIFATYPMWSAWVL